MGNFIIAIDILRHQSTNLRIKLGRPLLLELVSFFQGLDCSKSCFLLFKRLLDTQIQVWKNSKMELLIPHLPTISRELTPFLRLIFPSMLLLIEKKSLSISKALATMTLADNLPTTSLLTPKSIDQPENYSPSATTLAPAKPHASTSPSSTRIENVLLASTSPSPTPE